MPHCDRAASARFLVDMLSKTNRTAIVESWGIRTALAQLPHGCLAVPVQYPWNRTDIAQSSCVNPTAVAPWPCVDREMCKLFVGVFVDVFHVHVFSCIICLNFSIKWYYLSGLELRIPDYRRSRWVGLGGSRRAGPGRSGRAACKREAPRENGLGEAMATETGHPWALRHPYAGIDAGIAWRLQIIPQNRASHVPGDGQNRHRNRISVQPLHGSRTGSVRSHRKLAETVRSLHWNCTIAVQSPRSLRTDLFQSVPRESAPKIAQ